MLAVIGSATLFLVGAAGAATDVEVRLVGSRLQVRAASVPLHQLLDRISRQTGMRVVYEGGVPRSRVTADLEDRTPAQAIVAILEGLGLSYALQMDETGTRVRTLLFVGTGRVATAATAPASPASAPGLLAAFPLQDNRQQQQKDEEAEEDEEDEEEEEEAEEEDPDAERTVGAEVENTPAGSQLSDPASWPLERRGPLDTPPGALGNPSPPPALPKLPQPAGPGWPWVPGVPQPLTLPAPQAQPSPTPSPTPSPSPSA